MSQVCTFLESPLGRLRLVAEAGALCGVYFPEHKHASTTPLERRDDEPVLVEASRQLSEYFLGSRTAFALPLRAAGTAFQQQVWERLREIPFGETSSYRALAVEISRPSACRAVGAANGRNPLSIVVPCHRVVGSDGSLTGYAGGEPAKKWLLAHEAALVRTRAAAAELEP